MNADAARLFEAVSLMQGLLTLIIIVISFFVVLISGKSSTNRTLIAIGLALQMLTSLSYIAITMSRHVQVIIEVEVQWLLYGVLRMIDIAGFLMMIVGVIGLIRRAGLLELIQEDLESR